MVPKKSRFCPKVPNFAFVASFRAKSQIPNPVSERLLLCPSAWQRLARLMWDYWQPSALPLSTSPFCGTRNIWWGTPSPLTSFQNCAQLNSHVEKEKMRRTCLSHLKINWQSFLAPPCSPLSSSPTRRTWPTFLCPIFSSVPTPAYSCYRPYTSPDAMRSHYLLVLFASTQLSTTRWPWMDWVPCF